MTEQIKSQEFVAFIGIDWADEKHDIRFKPQEKIKSAVNKFIKHLRP